MRFRRSALVVGLVASTIVLARRGPAQPAVAPPRLAVALQVTTVEGCPAERFQRALEARVRRPLEIRGEASSSLRVAIVAAGAARFEGTASFAGASGRATRAIRGTCDEVTAALALVATTWLEAEPLPEPERAAAAAAAGAAAASTPEPSAAPLTTEPPSAPAAAEPAVPPAASASAPSPSATPTVERAPPPAARETRASPDAPPALHRFAVGAHGVATFGVVGGPAAGGGLAIAYRRPRLELRGGIRAAFGGESIEAGPARYVWLTVPLDGCLHVLTRGPFAFAGCARIEPGYFNATFLGTDRALPWLSLGFGLRGGWSVGPVRLEIEVFEGVPVTGYRITPTDATIVPFRAIVPMIAAGVMVPFS
jgi:hypothetical protein